MKFLPVAARFLSSTYLFLFAAVTHVNCLPGKIRSLLSAIFFLLGFVFLSGFAQAQTPLPQDDEQFWSEAQLSGTLIKDKLDLTFWEFWRHGRGVSFPTDVRTGVGLTIKVNKHLTLQPTYLYLLQRPWPGVKNFSHRLVFDATTKFTLGKFTFTNRHRYEHQLRHGRRNNIDLRERLTIDHPVRVGDFEFKVFVSDEIFHSSIFNAVYRNRLAAGITKNIHPRLSADFYYLRQNDGRSRPGDLQVFGTVLRVRLWD
jgi:hypothetical protein